MCLSFSVYSSMTMPNVFLFLILSLFSLSLFSLFSLVVVVASECHRQMLDAWFIREVQCAAIARAFLGLHSLKGGEGGRGAAGSCDNAETMHARSLYTYTFINNNNNK